MIDAAVDAGASSGLINCMNKITLEGSEEMIAHKCMAFETTRPPDMAMRTGTPPAGPIYGPAPDEIETLVEKIVKQILKV